LDIGSSPVSEAQTQVLVDYLTGACGDFDGQCFSSQISRLVVLGNSLAPLEPGDGAADEEKEDKKPVRHVVFDTSLLPDPYILVHSADTEMTTPLSHRIPSRTSLPTFTTCLNQSRFTSFRENPIPRGQSFLNKPSHEPWLALPPPSRPSPAKQIPHISV
jgi:hypothetical protein